MIKNTILTIIILFTDDNGQEIFRTKGQYTLADVSCQHYVERIDNRIGIDIGQNLNLTVIGMCS